MGTLFSLLFSLSLLFYPPLDQDLASIAGSSTTAVGIAMVAVGIAFLVFLSLVYLLSWEPLQRAETNVTPRLLELFRKDLQIRMIDFWFVFFFILSVVGAFDLFTVQRLPLIPLVAGWVIGLGVSIDLLHHLIKRVFQYMDPFTVADMFIERGRHSIQNDDTKRLCQTVDALSEIATKSVESSSSSLSNHTIESLATLQHHFLESTKTVGHDDGSRAGYILYFILQRVETVFEKGLLMHLEPACTTIITALGKMAFNAAECDFSLTAMPLRSIGKLAFEAEEKGWHEVSDKGLCTLLEVANAIITDLDLSYGDLKDPLMTLNIQMEMITKSMFTNDKAMNFELLRQPFHVFKELLQQDKLKENQDIPVVIQDIDRVLADFASLEGIMRAVPPIPQVVEQK